MFKKIISIIKIFLVSSALLAGQGKKSALVLIDIQDFYFPGGKSALVNPESAARNAAILLSHYRKLGLPVIHIAHNSEPGGKINDLVKPVSSEKIIRKNEVNSFLNTNLKHTLDSLGTDTLVICGMQTHMCVEAAARAGHDLGYTIILIHDACATKDLTFGENTIKSADVHNATLATIKSYGIVKSTSEYLNNK